MDIKAPDRNTLIEGTVIGASRPTQSGRSNANKLLQRALRNESLRSLKNAGDERAISSKDVALSPACGDKIKATYEKSAYKNGSESAVEYSSDETTGLYSSFTFSSSDDLYIRWESSLKNGATQEQTLDTAKDFLSVNRNYDRHAYVYKHRESLGNLPLEDLEPPRPHHNAISDVDTALDAWLWACLTGRSDRDLYAGVFFALNPTDEYILQVYRLPLNFDRWSEELDKHQDILGSLGRRPTCKWNPLERLTSQDILDLWILKSERLESKTNWPLCKEEERHFGLAFLRKEPSLREIEILEQSNLSTSEIKQELREYSKGLDRTVYPDRKQSSEQSEVKPSEMSVSKNEKTKKNERRSTASVYEGPTRANESRCIIS